MRKLQNLIKNEENRRAAQAKNSGFFEMHLTSDKGEQGNTLGVQHPDDLTLESQLERLGFRVLDGRLRLLAQLNATGSARVRCNERQMVLKVSHAGIITVEDAPAEPHLMGPSDVILYPI